MIILHGLRAVVADSSFTSGDRIQAALTPYLRDGDVLADLRWLYRHAATKHAQRSGRLVRLDPGSSQWSGIPLKLLRRALTTRGLAGYQIAAVTRSPWERLAAAWYYRRLRAWSLERFVLGHPLCPSPLPLNAALVRERITWLREDHLAADLGRWTRAVGITAPLDWVPTRPAPWERLGHRIERLYTPATVDFVARGWARGLNFFGCPSTPTTPLSTVHGSTPS